MTNRGRKNSIGNKNLSEYRFMLSVVALDVSYSPFFIVQQASFAFHFATPHFDL